MIRGHRRSVSNPYTSFSPSTSSKKSILANTKKMSRTFDYTDEKVKVAKHRKWNSLPDLHHETFTAQRPRSKTIGLRDPSFKLEKKVSFKSEVLTDEALTVASEAITGEEVPYFEYKDSAATLKSLVESKPSVPVHVVNVEDIKIHTDYRYSPEYQKSPTSSKPKVMAKKLSMFSFLDHASNASKLATSASPSMSTSPTDIFFSVVAVPGAKIHSSSPIAQSMEDSCQKRKSSRQNLSHFLQTINNGSRQKVALDRENAHFHLSEAIIATSQQLKWNKILSEKYKIPKDVRIKEDLSYSPKHHQFQPPMPNPKFTVGSLEDDSESSLSNDEGDKATSSSSEDINENIPQMEWNIADDPHSAESIAMMLMSKFKNQKLPNPNSLMWLVNESQTPQQLLPFPDSFSFPVNPDEPFHVNSFIRGSKDWAPPRQQIIFTIHQTPDRRRQCLTQSNRCAGCGMKVQVQYITTFRYCDYLGKYFCSACHKNQISTIPARVLDKWDFSLYPVSNFAYKWLDQIWSLPLFHVADLKPQLYEKAKALKKARESRLQLKYVQDFIEQCRFAEKEQGYCSELPSHWSDDADIWSMTDFMDVKNGIFSERIQEIVTRLEEHIIKNNCQVRLHQWFQWDRRLIRIPILAMHGSRIPLWALPQKARHHLPMAEQDKAMCSVWLVLSWQMLHKSMRQMRKTEAAKTTNQVGSPSDIQLTVIDQVFMPINDSGLRRASSTIYYKQHVCYHESRNVLLPKYIARKSWQTCQDDLSCSTSLKSFLTTNSNFQSTRVINQNNRAKLRKTFKFTGNKNASVRRCRQGSSAWRQVLHFT